MLELKAQWFCFTNVMKYSVYFFILFDRPDKIMVSGWQHTFVKRKRRMCKTLSMFDVQVE